MKSKKDDSFCGYDNYLDAIKDGVPRSVVLGALKNQDEERRVKEWLDGAPEREKKADKYKKEYENEVKEHRAWIRKIKKRKRPSYDDLHNLKSLQSWSKASEEALYAEFGGPGYANEIKAFLVRHGYRF